MQDVTTIWRDTSACLNTDELEAMVQKLRVRYAECTDASIKIQINDFALKIRAKIDLLKEEEMIVERLHKAIKDEIKLEKGIYHIEG